MKIRTGIIPKFTDARGQLNVLEGANLPFPVKRIYFISQVDGEAVRGNHAHKSLNQVFWAVGGNVTLTLDDGVRRDVYVLRDSTDFVAVPAGYWREISLFTTGSILIVAASEEFDESDYIRNYSDFKKWKEM